MWNNHAITLEYSVAMETLYKILASSTYAFVVFESILLNATTVIEVLKFYKKNKRKINYFIRKISP